MLQSRVFFWLVLFELASWHGEFGEARVQLSWSLIGDGIIGAATSPQWLPLLGVFSSVWLWNVLCVHA